MAVAAAAAAEESGDPRGSSRSSSRCCTPLEEEFQSIPPMQEFHTHLLRLETSEGKSLWMRCGEELTWSLSELCDLLTHRLPEDFIVLQTLQIHCPCVREMEKEIVGLLCFLSVLLESEDEIDPAMQIPAHVLGFQGCTVELDEMLWIPGPSREDDIPDCLPVLGDPEIVMIHIPQEFRSREEFRCQFLEAAQTLQTIVPGLTHTPEQTIRIIEMTTLQLHMQTRKRFQTEQIESDRGCVAVVRTVMEGRKEWIRIPFHELETFQDTREAFRIQGSDRFTQIPEDLLIQWTLGIRITTVDRLQKVWILRSAAPSPSTATTTTTTTTALCSRSVQVRIRPFEVSGRSSPLREVVQDPWEDRVLIQIVVAPTCDRVQGLEIFEITDLPATPAFGESCLPENLLRSEESVGEETRWLEMTDLFQETIPLLLRLEEEEPTALTSSAATATAAAAAAAATRFHEQLRSDFSQLIPPLIDRTEVREGEMTDLQALLVALEIQRGEGKTEFLLLFLVLLRRSLSHPLLPSLLLLLLLLLCLVP